MTPRGPLIDPELDDTADELVTSARRVTGPHPRLTTGEIVRVDVADGPTEVGEWALLRQLRLEIADARNEAAEARLDAVEAKQRAGLAAKRLGRAQAFVAGGVGLVGVGVLAVLKLAFASGARSNEAERVERERIVTRDGVVDLQQRVIPTINVSLATHGAEIAGLRAALDTLSRLGAVRVAGPPPQPLLPGEP